ncbi:MAG: hypothetical protein WAU54_08070 [Chania sp.]
MQTLIPLRLLEVNSSLIWHWPHLQEVIAVMKRDRFNGLVVHQQDLLALLVLPSLYCLHSRENLLRERQERLLYLQRLSCYCNLAGIGVWLQGGSLSSWREITGKVP